MKNFMNSEILNDFIKICTLDQLSESKGIRFMIDDTDIAVFKIGNDVFAVNNICPHQQSALIYDGFIEEGYVVCPAHGWMFNLKTGKTPSGTNGLNTHEIKISGNDVFIKISKREWNW